MYQNPHSSSKVRGFGLVLTISRALYECIVPVKVLTELEVQGCVRKEERERECVFILLSTPTCFYFHTLILHFTTHFTTVLSFINKDL